MRKRNTVTALGACLCLCLLLGGCFSFETAKLSSCGDEIVYVANYGWYLFGSLPLATGNAREGAKFPTVFFRNDVTMEKIQGRIIRYAEKQGKEMHDLTYHNHDSVLFNIPGLDFPLPIPYILTYRELQLSGVMK